MIIRPRRGLISDRAYAESVREFQPRVALWQPWEQHIQMSQDGTLKGLRSPSVESQLLQSCEDSLAAFNTQGFKANPGLKLANAFSVIS